MPLILETEYLCFKDISTSSPLLAKRKTKTYQVENKQGHLLGWIAWHSGWRRYVFSATNNQIIFDAVCLTAIAGFLTALMEEYKHG